jgi:folate-binding protein YgfZ
VPAEGRDAGVAWHYGDPFGEQRRWESGGGVVDLSHRGVLRVTGADRLTWLHSLTTQHLADLPPWTSTEALVLDPHGRVEHALHLVDDGEATWITVEPGTAGRLVEWLLSMRFLRRVEVVDVTADWAVLADRRPGPDDAGVSWSDPWPTVGPESASYAAVPPDQHPARGRVWREVLVPRCRLVDRVDPATLVGTWAAEALRVAAWRPRLGMDTDHRSIPHELDWLRTAVHLRKGCYRGQETVARVHNLGRPPRRLTMLNLDGSGHDLPAAGTPVESAGRAVGVVTTPARHHELGPIALALVKRSVPTDVVLSAAGIAAAQEVVVAP